jgi:hypothetical protein
MEAVTNCAYTFGCELADTQSTPDQHMQKESVLMARYCVIGAGAAGVSA